MSSTSFRRLAPGTFRAHVNAAMRGGNAAFLFGRHLSWRNFGCPVNYRSAQVKVFRLTGPNLCVRGTHQPFRLVRYSADHAARARRSAAHHMPRCDFGPALARTCH